MTTNTIADLRLQQLVSAGLPIGSFAYSQGLEWAVQQGWVENETALQDWVEDILDGSLRYLEVPVFFRLFDCYDRGDFSESGYWVELLLANRETFELINEEKLRGRAFLEQIRNFGVDLSTQQQQLIGQCHLAGFAFLCSEWRLDPGAAINALLWGWLENMVLCGVKLIPLGQNTGQRIIYNLSQKIPGIVTAGKSLDEIETGGSCMAQAIASSRHETQYTRLYRS